MIAGLAVIVYYLHGFSPISPDDMASLNAAVSEGIHNVSSEQASLGQSVSEMVNSAEFRADQLNMSTEAMLRDIAFAGDAARIQLEQTYTVTQDLNQLYSRVSYLDERSTNIIRGIVYLIGLRWALINNSADGATGSEVVNVNEVLSLERPFSFSEVVEPTATVSIQTEEIEPTVTRSLSTQTDHMSFDRIYELLFPYVAAYGAARVLWRLRSILPVIGDSIEEADSETTQHSPESSTPHRRSVDVSLRKGLLFLKRRR